MQDEEAPKPTLRDLLRILRTRTYTRFEKLGLYVAAGLFVLMLLTCDWQFGGPDVARTDDPVMQAALRHLPQAVLLPSVTGWIFSDDFALSRVEDPQQVAAIARVQPVWSATHFRLVRWDVQQPGLHVVGVFLVGENAAYQLCPVGSQMPLQNPTPSEITDLLKRGQAFAEQLEKEPKA